MPWLYWIGGGLFAWWYDSRQQRLAALQAIDVSLLAIKSETQNAADTASTAQLTTGASTTGATGTAAATTTTIQTANGQSITAESGITSALQTMIQALGPSVSASQWLALAASLRGSNFPIAANSVAALGMTYVETGVVGNP